MKDYHGRTTNVRGRTTNVRIAVIPGDGIGQEVAPVGIKALETASELLGGFRLNLETFPWGCSYYLSHGRMMPQDGLKTLESFDAIYFGAPSPL